MGNSKLFYQAILLLPLLFTPSFSYGTTSTTKKEGYVPVPCVEHSFCWFYCQIVIDQNLGSGCCWEKKYSDKDGILHVIQSLSKSCWCCKAPSVIGLAPGAADKFCENIHTVTNTTDDLLNNVCLVQNLGITCSMVKLNLNLNLITLDANCQGGGSGSLLPPGLF